MGDVIFVGREAELEKLHSLQESALAGCGSCGFLAGEAGAGKSALLNEFVRQAQQRHEEVVVVVGRCNAQTGSGDPYLPFMEILALLTGDAEAATAKGTMSEKNAARLDKVARSSAKMLVELAPDIIGAFVPGSSLVAKLGKTLVKQSGVLSKLDRPAKPEKTELSAELDSQQIFKQYTDILTKVSSQSPLIVVIDDMQWADTASINLFTHLSTRLRNSRVLLLGTYRPNDIAIDRGEDRHPLIPALNEMKRIFGDILIDLEGIDPQERQRFVEMLVNAEPNRLDAEFKRRLFEHTNGHPLFTVELLHSFKEGGNLVLDGEGHWISGADLDWDVLPPRVEGVVEERIGRLEERMREILATGSIEGQSFTAQVVAQLHEMSEREILKYLSHELEKRHRLVKEGSTEKIGKNWLSQFSFSQSMFQHYLYNEMSERERMILHGDVAELLEEIYKDKRDKVLLQLARHYDMSGEADKAVECLLGAGRQAIRISAYEQARMHLLRALVLLDELPDDDERARSELDIQLALSTVYKATLGWDSPEVTSAYYRARELCGRLQLQHELAPIIFGLWSIHLMHLELPQALQMAQEYLELSQQEQDADMLLHAWIALGNTCFWMGRITQSRQAMEEAQRIFEPGRDYISDFGQDPGVLAVMFLGFCDWLLGRPEQARQYEAQMMGMAEGCSHHFTMAIALYGAATLDYHLHDYAAMKAHTDQLIRISEEHHFPLYYGLGVVYRGWLEAYEGDAQLGARQIEEGFGQWICQYNGKVTHSLYCVMLAEALQRGGQTEQALATVERGIEVAHECAEHCYEPELLRLRAELLQERAAPVPAVEAAFLAAIECGRGQQEWMLVTRAMLGYARFLRNTGREAEAAALENEIAGEVELAAGITQEA